MKLSEEKRKAYLKALKKAAGGGFAAIDTDGWVTLDCSLSPTDHLRLAHVLFQLDEDLRRKA
jgi:hypothetical protein